MIPGAVMIASGVVCLGGAVAARNRLGIAAALIMALSMADLVLWGWVPQVVWVVLLVLAGMAMGAGLRFRQPHAYLAPGAGLGLGRAVMAASALAYPAMAWLVLAHDHASPAASASPASEPAAAIVHTHGSLIDAVSLLVIAPLTLVLLVLGVLALRQRRLALAIEAGAMTAMLLAMLIPMSM